MEKEKEKSQDKPVPPVNNGKSKQRRLLRRKAKERSVDDDVNMTSLPPPFQNKLQSLFIQIEKEFERLHHQNNTCMFFLSFCFCFNRRFLRVKLNENLYSPLRIKQRIYISAITSCRRMYMYSRYRLRVSAFCGCAQG